jgi:proteasome lid subunit RPN8/RPN11
MLILKREQYAQIVAHARSGLPYESCGLIAGEVRDLGHAVERVVSKVYTLANIDKSAEHFSMETAEQFRVIADIRKNHTALIGNFHSHPVTPARPSAEDIRHAYDRELVYVILSLMEEEPRLKGFLIRDGSYREETVRIE